MVLVGQCGQNIGKPVTLIVVNIPENTLKTESNFLEKTKLQCR